MALPCLILGAGGGSGVPGARGCVGVHSTNFSPIRDCGRMMQVASARKSWNAGSSIRITTAALTFGARPLQQIKATEIDSLYARLEERLSPNTVRFIHAVLGSCFNAAVRKGLLIASPVARANTIDECPSEKKKPTPSGRCRS